MYNETDLKAVNSSLKICWEPLEEALLGYRGTQTVRALMINTRGRWLLIAPYDISYPCTVNVAAAQVGHQGQLKHVFPVK